MKRGIYISIEGPNGSGKSTLAKKILKYLESLGISAILNTQPTKKSVWREVLGGFEGKSNAIGVLIRELIEKRTPTDEMLNNYLLKVKELKRICFSRHLEDEQDSTLLTEFISTLFSAHSLIVDGKSLDEKIMQTLYCADGLFDFKETVIPAVDNGIWVIQDRERFTSFAHGDAGGFPFLENLKIHQIVLGEYYIKPDLMFYIDTPLDICVEHLSNSGKTLDIYEGKESIGCIIRSYKKAIEYCNENPEVGYKNILKLDGTQDENVVFARASYEIAMMFFED